MIFSIGKSRDFIDSVIDFDLRGVGSGLRGGWGLIRRGHTNRNITPIPSPPNNIKPYTPLTTHPKPKNLKLKTLDKRVSGLGLNPFVKGFVRV